MSDALSSASIVGANWMMIKVPNRIKMKTLKGKRLKKKKKRETSDSTSNNRSTKFITNPN